MAKKGPQYKRVVPQELKEQQARVPMIIARALNIPTERGRTIHEGDQKYTYA